MPTEYLCFGQYSVKFDVYNFGIIVLEIITGLKHKRDIEDQKRHVSISFILVFLCVRH